MYFFIALMFFIQLRDYKMKEEKWQRAKFFENTALEVLISLDLKTA